MLKLCLMQSRCALVIERFISYVLEAKVRHFRATQMAILQAIRKRREKDHIFKKAEQMRLIEVRLLERQKKNVVVIQRNARKWFAMKEANSRRRERDKVNYVIMVQTVFRRKKAIQEIASRRRHLYFRDKVNNPLRKRQGAILRFAGVRSRKRQRQILKFVDPLGLNLTDYDFHPGRLRRKVFHDFKLTLHKIQTGFTIATSILKADKTVISDKGEANFRAGDCVKIVKRGSPYQGITGFILQVVESPEKVAEIKLDGPLRRVVYVNLPTSSDGPSPLKLVNTMQLHLVNASKLEDIRPAIRAYCAQEKDRFRDDKAARVIQLAYRQKVAKRKAARLRYMKWDMIRDSKLAVLNVANAWDSTFEHSFSQLASWRTISTNAIPSQPSQRKPVPDRLRQYRRRHLSAMILRSETLEKKSDRRCFYKGLKKRSSLCEDQIRLKDLMKISFIPSSIKRAVFRWSSLKRTPIWIDTYDFSMFFGSPHQRGLHGMALYHGQWDYSKDAHKPYPSGKGIIQFLDAWGTKADEKEVCISNLEVRNITEKGGRSCNPFATITALSAKGLLSTTIRTEIRKNTTNPSWREYTYRLNMTDPDGQVKFSIFDRERFSTDLIGEIVLSLRFLLTQKSIEHSHDVYLPLKKRGKARETTQDGKGQPVGTVSFKMEWLSKEDDYDLFDRRIRNSASTLITSLFLRSRAQKMVDKARKQRLMQTKYINTIVIGIQALFRATRAKKKVKRARFANRVALKIQKIWRGYSSRLYVQRLKLQIAMATRIQTATRSYLSRRKLQFLRNQLYSLHYLNACVLQCMFRKCAASIRVRKLQSKESPLALKRRILMISNVLYGYDSLYGTPRNRRILLRIFDKIIRGVGMTLKTPLGDVFSTGEMVINTFDGIPYYYVITCIYGKAGIFRPQEERKSGTVKEKVPAYTLIMFYKSGEDEGKPEGWIDPLSTTSEYVVRVQRGIRGYFGRKIFERLVRRKEMAIRLQKYFRQCLFAKSVAVTRIGSVWRRKLAIRQLSFKRREILCAVTIQSSFRRFQAMKSIREKRVIENIDVTYESSTRDVSLFRAHNTLKPGKTVVWCSAHHCVKDEAIIYDLGKKGSVVGLDCIEISVPADTTAPKHCQIAHSTTISKRSASARNSSQNETPAFKVVAEFVVENRSRPSLILITKHVSYTSRSARYWRLTFYDNWGSNEHIIVHSIKFFRRKEGTYNHSSLNDSNKVYQ